LRAIFVQILLPKTVSLAQRTVFFLRGGWGRFDFGFGRGSLCILRLHNPLIKCIIIAAHAPHTGADASLISEWWADLAATIPAKYHHWVRILLSDANARVAANPRTMSVTTRRKLLTLKPRAFCHSLVNKGYGHPPHFLNSIRD